MSVIVSEDFRLQQLSNWLAQVIPQTIIKIVALKNDASFRRYFRVHTNNMSWIAMDAPPEKENCQPFVALAKGLLRGGVHTPEILAANLEQGFLLLSDFGDHLLLNHLDESSVENHYTVAMDTLIPLQRCNQFDNFQVPLFDAIHIQNELNLFTQWYLTDLLQLSLTSSQHKIIVNIFQLLIKNAEQQPQVLIHRDYHSRNLMLLNNGKIGVIDFQDAMIGPITYDLVSLLKDCYVKWPQIKIHAWVKQFYQLVPLEKNISYDQFLMWFDLIGLQRHLKVLGVFSRLHLRDRKSTYLNDIPRILSYVLEAANSYPEFADFSKLLIDLDLTNKNLNPL
jgi:aminoglycoside/choline kinase family phosphotransferase